MADVLGLLERFGAPVATGVGGFIGAAFNYKRRVDTLEAELAGLKTGIDARFDKAVEDAKEVSDEQAKKYKELFDQLKELTARFESYQRGSISSFADASEMHSFMEQQRAEWLNIQRTLGQIEGWLQNNAPPSPFPRSLPTNPRR